MVIIAVFGGLVLGGTIFATLKRRRESRRRETELHIV